MSGDDRWQVEAPGQVALSLPLAGVGARGLATLLDLLAVFLCWVVGLFVYSIWGDLLGRWQGLSWLGQLLVVGAVLAAGWGCDVVAGLGRGLQCGCKCAGLQLWGPGRERYAHGRGDCEDQRAGVHLHAEHGDRERDERGECVG